MHLPLGDETNASGVPKSAATQNEKPREQSSPPGTSQKNLRRKSDVSNKL
jgi:hypothetical protein